MGGRGWLLFFSQEALHAWQHLAVTTVLQWQRSLWNGPHYTFLHRLALPLPKVRSLIHKFQDQQKYLLEVTNNLESSTCNGSRGKDAALQSPQSNLNCTQLILFKFQRHTSTSNEGLSRLKAIQSRWNEINKRHVLRRRKRVTSSFLLVALTLTITPGFSMLLSWSREQTRSVALFDGAQTSMRLSGKL